MGHVPGKVNVIIFFQKKITCHLHHLRCRAQWFHLQRRNERGGHKKDRQACNLQHLQHVSATCPLYPLVSPCSSCSSMFQWHDRSVMTCYDKVQLNTTVQCDSGWLRVTRLNQIWNLSLPRNCQRLLACSTRPGTKALQREVFHWRCPQVRLRWQLHVTTTSLWHWNCNLQSWLLKCFDRCEDVWSLYGTSPNSQIVKWHAEALPVLCFPQHHQATKELGMSPLPSVNCKQASLRSSWQDKQQPTQWSFRLVPPWLSARFLLMSAAGSTPCSSMFIHVHPCAKMPGQCWAKMPQGQCCKANAARPMPQGQCRKATFMAVLCGKDTNKLLFT